MHVYVCVCVCVCVSGGYLAAAYPPTTAAKANTCLMLQIMGINGDVDIQKWKETLKKKKI